MKKNTELTAEQELTPEQKWERATLANNFIFYKVMRHHPDACQHLLEMLLNIKIEKMTIANEEVIDIDIDAKSIRLDVYVKETERVYDIEIQVSDTKELPERARFYSSAMDLDILADGQDYEELPDSHVIFICMEKIFDAGLPVYTFENLCLEDRKTKLNDRSYKHFFIAPTCAKMIKDKEVKSFFEFLISNKAQTGYTADLSKYVADAKRNTQWRLQYMTVERLERAAFRNGHEQGVAEGIVTGEQKKAVKAAKNFYANGASIELIAKSLHMTEEQVQEIVKEPVTQQN